MTRLSGRRGRRATRGASAGRDRRAATRARRAARARGAAPPSRRRRRAAQWFESNPLWFKAATFYEIHVRGFFDANADGYGDFRGLTEKLDYLEWLGIDCIWLLPMYPSPLRDGGYDTSDFSGVHPDYGTIEDVREFIDAAHQRGIRVIADLVMNHTSSDHRWFQEARSSPDSPKRNWYVWSDTPRPLLRRADHLRRHRVLELDLGRAGRRVLLAPLLQPPAGPQLRRAGGAGGDARRRCASGSTSGSTASASTPCRTCSSARAPTARTCPRLTRSCAACARRSTPSTPTRCCSPRPTSGRRTSSSTSAAATSATWRSTSPSCRGCSWRCAARRAAPIVEILEHTPAIPDSCQWGLFLRNHDELTLEMVTDEERDYMYDEYARDPRMKLNLGIRRRLAPLLDNDRGAIELLTAIMFSLPGSPVLYYGDEIAMGDNVYLGDRDGVRTPMQWTGDRNGGFSRADFAQLFLPPLMDPVYGFQAVNIEAQLRTPASMLRWLRRFIGLRKEHPVFGLGSYEALAPSNPRIFAHIRRYEDDIVLCVHNLARTRAGRRARPRRIRRPLSGRDGRPHALPAHRRAPLPPDAAPARLLLVPARAGDETQESWSMPELDQALAAERAGAIPIRAGLAEWVVRAALVRREIARVRPVQRARCRRARDRTAAARADAHRGADARRGPMSSTSCRS